MSSSVFFSPRSSYRDFIRSTARALGATFKSPAVQTAMLGYRKALFSGDMVTAEKWKIMVQSVAEHEVGIVCVHLFVMWCSGYE